MSPDPRTETASRSYFGTFSDPDAMASAIGGINSGSSPNPLGGPGRNFQAMLARAVFDGLNIGIGKFARGIPQTAAIPNVHTFMFATEPGIVRQVSGRKLFGRRIFHFRPDERTVTASPAGMPWAFGIVAMPFDLLAGHAPDLIGTDHGVPLNDDRMFHAPEVALARLTALMRDMAEVIRATPWIVDAPQPAKALSGTILDSLLACLAHGRVSADRAALGRHRDIVARFERVVEERPEEMLSLGAICAAVGVPQRTLNLACQEFLGESAMHYARNCRLDRVRETLLVSDPASTLITGVAMHYGFWELGRFAQAYRLRFGERPSDTLRRNAH